MEKPYRYTFMYLGTYLCLLHSSRRLQELGKRVNWSTISEIFGIFKNFRIHKYHTAGETIRKPKFTNDFAKHEYYAPF